MTALKFDISIALVVFVAAAAVGQAQQAQQAPKSPQAANTASAPTTTAASQKTAVASPSAAKPSAADQLIKEARNAGFKPVMLRGTQMFCRTAVELGSSFPVRTCYDSDQVKIKIHEYQEERMQLEQMHGNGAQPP